MTELKDVPLGALQDLWEEADRPVNGGRTSSGHSQGEIAKELARRANIVTQTSKAQLTEREVEVGKDAGLIKPTTSHQQARQGNFVDQLVDARTGKK